MRILSTRIDLRVAQRVNIYTGRLREFLFYLYPRMFAIHNLPDAVGEIIAESTRVLLPKWELLSFQVCFLLFLDIKWNQCNPISFPFSFPSLFRAWIPRDATW